MTSKRGNGEGSVYLRADGRWVAVVDLGYRNGKRTRKSVYGHTRAEVAARMIAVQRDRQQGIAPIGERMTVSAWLDEWLETSVKVRCRPRTLDSYRDTVGLYIRPAVGQIPLAKLQPTHVSRMLSDLTARGDLSPTTVRYAYVVVRIALGRALKSGRVARNVATLVDPPAKATPEMHPLCADQVRVFLRTVQGDRLAALYVTAVHCGLRSGELLALTWDDIDLEARSLAVRRTRNARTGDMAEPKTASSRRTLRLGTEVTSALREHRRRQLEERIAAGARWQDQGLVFTATNGGALDGSNVLHRFQRALTAAGLPRQRLHDLRHAAATMLIEDGEDLAVVSKLLGHSNLSTTADVYAHLTSRMSQRAADRMDAILGGRETG